MCKQSEFDFMQKQILTDVLQLIDSDAHRLVMRRGQWCLRRIRDNTILVLPKGVYDELTDNRYLTMSDFKDGGYTIRLSQKGQARLLY